MHSDSVALFAIVLSGNKHKITKRGINSHFSQIPLFNIHGSFSWTLFLAIKKFQSIFLLWELIRLKKGRINCDDMQTPMHWNKHSLRFKHSSFILWLQLLIAQSNCLIFFRLKIFKWKMDWLRINAIWWCTKMQLARPLTGSNTLIDLLENTIQCDLSFYRFRTNVQGRKKTPNKNQMKEKY